MEFARHVKAYGRSTFCLFADDRHIITAGVQQKKRRKAIDEWVELQLRDRNTLDLLERIRAPSDLCQLWADASTIYAACTGGLHMFGAREGVVTVYTRKPLEMVGKWWEDELKYWSIFGYGGQLFAGASEGYVILRAPDPATGRELGVIKALGSGTNVGSVWVDHDYIYIGGYSHNAVVHDRTSRERVAMLKHEEENVNAICANAHQIYTITDKLYIWSRETFECIHGPVGENIVAMACDGEHAYTGTNDGKIQVFEDGELARCADLGIGDGGEGPIGIHTLFYEGANLLSGSTDGSIHIWSRD